MRIAFVGGTRFIGHVAAERAIVCGHEATVIHRGVHACEVKGAQEVIADRGDPEALARALEVARPEVVVDTWAMTRRDAETCGAVVARLDIPAVVLSSMDVYAQFGRLNGLPAPDPESTVTESSPLTIPYPFRGLGAHDGGHDYDKKDVEQAYASALDRRQGVTFLRLPAVYGRRDRKRRFSTMVDALDASKGASCTLRCKNSASLRMTHVHVDDAAHAIVIACEAPRAARSIYNVGEETTPPMRERVERIAAAMNVELRWDECPELPDELWELGPLANDFVASSAKIRAALAFREITTEDERVRDLVAWLRFSRVS